MKERNLGHPKRIELKKDQNREATECSRTKAKRKRAAGDKIKKT